jgi:hypothetical protein
MTTKWIEPCGLQVAAGLWSQAVLVCVVPDPAARYALTLGVAALGRRSAPSALKSYTPAR